MLVHVNDLSWGNIHSSNVDRNLNCLHRLRAVARRRTSAQQLEIHLPTTLNTKQVILLCTTTALYLTGSLSHSLSHCFTISLALYLTLCLTASLPHCRSISLSLYLVLYLAASL